MSTTASSSLSQNCSEGCNEEINKKTEVKLRIYDISNGLISLFSMQLLGEKLEGLWHTALQIYDFEYFYGGGIVKKLPADVEKDFGIHPVKIILLGFIDINMNDFENYLVTLSNKYIEENYDLINQNCNNFTNEVCEFLFGYSIPSYIIDLPMKVQKSPFGSTIINMITSQQKNMNSENREQCKSSLWNVEGSVPDQSMYGFDTNITNSNISFLSRYRKKEFDGYENEREKEKEEKERLREILNELKEENNLLNKDLHAVLRLILVIMVNIILYPSLQNYTKLSVDTSDIYAKLLKYKKVENLLFFLGFVSDNTACENEIFLDRQQEQTQKECMSLIYRSFSMAKLDSKKIKRFFRIMNQIKATIRDLSDQFSVENVKAHKSECSIFVNSTQSNNTLNNMDDLQAIAEFDVSKPKSNEDLKLKYANELSFLNEMGFLNDTDNLRALQETNGNTDAAVSLLLNE